MAATTSGISAYLTRKKFESLIDRHGQALRWLAGYDCSCIGANGQPDPRHLPCQGRGRIYKYVDSFESTFENSPHKDSLVCPANKPIISVESVMRCNHPYDIVSFNDDFITIGLKAPLTAFAKPHEVISVNYNYKRSTRKTVTDVTVLDDNTMILDSIIFVAPRTGYIYPQAIINVVSVTDTTDALALTPDGYNRNTLNVDETLNPAHAFECVVDVIDPFVWMVQGISEKKRYEDAYVGEQGQASLTLPYDVFVGNGDLITVLGAERRQVDILEAAASISTYELRAFDVSRLLTIIDNDGDDNYILGTDFQLIPNDKIKFISGGRKPSGKFSVVYLLNPTFAVVDDVPMLRTGENNRFPRKVDLKVFTKMHSEFELNTDEGFELTD